MGPTARVKTVKRTEARSTLRLSVQSGNNCANADANSEQGVRGILHGVRDLCRTDLRNFARASEIPHPEWLQRASDRSNGSSSLAPEVLQPCEATSP